MTKIAVSKLRDQKCPKNVFYGLFFFNVLPAAQKIRAKTMSFSIWRELGNQLGRPNKSSRSACGTDHLNSRDTGKGFLGIKTQNSTKVL